ncbi:cobalamin biosynthesis protein [Rhodoplanes azumiensis]|uniref:Cobalamin biosynthesis protein n=1 Tax=Rhodoplanes azumiensis TaxID=1897628 RepID=A0ABW5AEX2_9BRAD
MAGEEAVTVAGVGFRKGTSAADIVQAVQLATKAYGVDIGSLTALATAAFKADEAGVRAAAATLGVPLFACTPAELDRVGDRVLTRSGRVEAAVGVASVAEAAALAAAGRNATLLGPRVATARATCALAIGDGP